MPDEWQARQAILAILQVSGSKHNVKQKEKLPTCRTLTHGLTHLHLDQHPHYSLYARTLLLCWHVLTRKKNPFSSCTALNKRERERERERERHQWSHLCVCVCVCVCVCLSVCLSVCVCLCQILEKNVPFFCLFAILQPRHKGRKRCEPSARANPGKRNPTR